MKTNPESDTHSLGERTVSEAFIPGWAAGGEKAQYKQVMEKPAIHKPSATLCGQRGRFRNLRGRDPGRNRIPCRLSHRPGLHRRVGAVSKMLDLGKDCWGCMTSKRKAVAYWNLRGRQERTEKCHPDNGTLKGCKAAVARYWECGTRAEEAPQAQWPRTEFKAVFAEGWANSRREKRNSSEGVWSFLPRGQPLKSGPKQESLQTLQGIWVFTESKQKSWENFHFISTLLLFGFSPVFWRWNWDFPFSRAGVMSMRFRKLFVIYSQDASL